MLFGGVLVCLGLGFGLKDMTKTQNSAEQQPVAVVQEVTEEATMDATVDVVDVPEALSTYEVEEEPTTQAPTTEAPTTQAPAEDPVVVGPTVIDVQNAYQLNITVGDTAGNPATATITVATPCQKLEPIQVTGNATVDVVGVPTVSASAEAANVTVKMPQYIDQNATEIDVVVIVEPINNNVEVVPDDVVEPTVEDTTNDVVVDESTDVPTTEDTTDDAAEDEPVDVPVEENPTEEDPVVEDATTDDTTEDVVEEPAEEDNTTEDIVIENPAEEDPAVEDTTLVGGAISMEVRNYNGIEYTVIITTDIVDGEMVTTITAPEYDNFVIEQYSDTWAMDATEEFEMMLATINDGPAIAQ
jgi:hypothetical protein